MTIYSHSFTVYSVCA